MAQSRALNEKWALTIEVKEVNSYHKIYNKSMKKQKSPPYLMAALSLFSIFGLDGCANFDGQREQSTARLPHQRLAAPSPSSFPSWNFGELEDPGVVRGVTVLPHVQKLQTSATSAGVAASAAGGARIAPSFEEAYAQKRPQAVSGFAAGVAAGYASATVAENESAPGGGQDRPESSPSEVRLITFDFASSTPSRAAELLVQELALAAVNAPSITVTGRTDDSGDPAKNELLARARALAIKRLLVRAGVKDERIRISSCSNCFIRSNATELGRKQNRSVEVEIARPLARKG